MRAYIRPHIFFVLIAALAITGCDETQDIRNWVDNSGRLKTLALHESRMPPYRNTQHQAIKNYFASLVQMAVGLSNDSGLVGRFNKAASQTDLNLMCGRVFMTRTQWQSIMEACTRNRFFLCAEEVRAYTQSVLSLRSRFTPEQRRRFDQADNCSLAMY